MAPFTLKLFVLSCLISRSSRTDAWTTTTSSTSTTRFGGFPATTAATTTTRSVSSSCSSSMRSPHGLSLAIGDDDSWDDDVDYESEFPVDDTGPLDPALSWNAPEFLDDAPTLGIDFGKMLEPLSEKEAAELKAAAIIIIEDAIAEGIDDIEAIRAKMKKEIEKKRASMALASELNAQRESGKLLSKIDKLTNDFLASTESTRSSTKLAAAADQGMAGKSVEMGTWGDLGEAAVKTQSGKAVLLGSVEAAKTVLAPQSEDTTTQTKSIVVVADTQQDPLAKKLLPLLIERLEEALPGLEVSVYKPTATLPIGGDGAQCALLFCTSLSDKSSVYSLTERLLRKTMQAGGSIGRPPTQIVSVSTIGTERTNKMPYTMQNLMGGKLDKRRQIEEAVMNVVRERTAEPALDYTICKVGELKNSVPGDFAFAAGDVLDGDTQLDTAATILLQAIALQPSARNATLSCVGALPKDTAQEVLDDAFLRLDGPELVRLDLDANTETSYGPLVEYLREWAVMLEDAKGLTTPIRAQVPRQPANLPPGIVKAARVQVLFLPTATGRNYLSREEEKYREKRGASAKATQRPITAKEGGIEIVAEVTAAGDLRVRAKRCNYARDAVIKELSEETILSRFRKCIDVWKKDRSPS